jgi:hypothetical protein
LFWIAITPAPIADAAAIMHPTTAATANVFWAWDALRASIAARLNSPTARAASSSASVRTIESDRKAARCAMLARVSGATVAERVAAPAANIAALVADAAAIMLIITTERDTDEIVLIFRSFL